MAPPAAVRVRFTRLAVACALAASLGACGGDSGTRPTPTPTPLTREQAVREAVRITAAAQLEVMRSVRPGMREGDVKAIVERVFQREGADGVAFAHIVATGAHAVDAHYAGNDGVLAEGDLLVVDIGASREGWASDLTRTVPVSGRFTSRQRELYALALEGQELAMRRAHTGVDSLQNMQDWVIELYRASRLSASRAPSPAGRRRSKPSWTPAARAAPRCPSHRLHGCSPSARGASAGVTCSRALSPRSRPARCRAST